MMAYYVVYTFYASGAINMSVVFAVTIISLRRMAKKLYVKCFGEKKKKVKIGGIKQNTKTD